MSENSYQQLIDDYIKGIQVLEGESLTDYIKRMGGVDYPEKRAQGGRIGYARGTEREAGIMDLEADKMLMASESPQEELEMLRDIELLQEMKEFEEFKKNNPGKTYEDFKIAKLRLVSGKMSKNEMLKYIREMEKYGTEGYSNIQRIRSSSNRPRNPKRIIKPKLKLADGGVVNLLNL